jgi:hypothetical protein
MLERIEAIFAICSNHGPLRALDVGLFAGGGRRYARAVPIVNTP